MTPTDRAEALLREQREKLEAVIASDAYPTTRHLAKHYLAKVASWQRQPPAARVLCLGLMGPNGYGPAIDDVCWQAQFDVEAMRFDRGRVRAKAASTLQLEAE